MALLVVLSLIMGIMSPARAEEVLPLNQTNLQHFKFRPPEPIEPPPPADHMLRVEDHLAYRLPDKLKTWAVLDKRLSHLCQRGAFRQKWPMGLYAIAPEETYGVALADGANLYDPQHLAKPGMVYFFHAVEDSICHVFVANQSKLVKFARLRGLAGLN